MQLLNACFVVSRCVKVVVFGTKFIFVKSTVVRSSFVSAPQKVNMNASPKASSSASPTSPLDQSSSPATDPLPAYAKASNKSSLAGSQNNNKPRTSKEVWIPDEYRRKQIERDLSLLRDRPGTAGGSTSRSPAAASVSSSASASASSASGPVSPKELKELKRVFARLCQYSSNAKKQSQSPSSCKSSSRCIRVQDIAAALRDLGKKATKQEVLDMLWEADEKNDGVIDWDELQLMFQRCVRDASGREPPSLYYLIQFLSSLIKTPMVWLELTIPWAFCMLAWVPRRWSKSSTSCSATGPRLAAKAEDIQANLIL